MTSPPRAFESNDVVFYRQLWIRIVGEEFTVEKLGNRIRRDGGHDISNLTDSDLLALIEDRFSGSKTEAAFSFSEMLAYYSVPGAIETPDQIVGWVVTSFIVADLIAENVIDWDLPLNTLIDGFVAVRDKLETEESIHILKRVFCDNAMNEGP